MTGSEIRDMPVSSGQASLMILLEAGLGAGITVSEFERDYLAAHQLDPIMATILHGWLIRAHLTGQSSTQ